MIKINLASRKQSGLAGDGRGKQANLGNQFKKIDFSQLQVLPFRKVVLPIVICAGVSFAVDNYMVDEVKKLDVFLEKTNAENAKIQIEVNKLKSYDAIEKSLKEDEL